MTKATTMHGTVLLVDDDPNLLSGLLRTLRHQPYRIFTARSGKEAKEVLMKWPVDVIVADEQMPGMTGSELLAWVADFFPEVTRIVLTGHASVEAAIRAINEGRVWKYFTKPCKDVDLALAIAEALEAKRGPLKTSTP
ncbi:MAG: response regulator [Planctomycetota bacterium]|nr:MAG: response regulator [Planctomycetota bacterium]